MFKKRKSDRYNLDEEEKTFKEERDSDLNRPIFDDNDDFDFQKEMREFEKRKKTSQSLHKP